MQKEVKAKPKYAIVAAVQLPNVSDIEFESSLAELRDLAKTLGYEIAATFTQKRTLYAKRNQRKAPVRCRGVGAAAGRKRR